MIFERIGKTLSDPFYRCEKRQARATGGWLRAAAALAGVVLCCVVGIWGIFIGAAIMGAETVLAELDGQTMESLLLTPADRWRIVRAKFLACMRTSLLPVAVLAALCLAGGGLLFHRYPDECAKALAGITGAPFEDRHCSWILGAALGLVLGVLAGALIIMHVATCAALGIRMAISTRSRAKCYLAAGGIILGGGLAEKVLSTLAFAISPMILAGSDFDSGLFWTLAAGAVVVRLGLLNVFLPIWLLRSSARRMDELLLRD